MNSQCDIFLLGRGLGVKQEPTYGTRASSLACGNDIPRQYGDDIGQNVKD